MGASNRVLLTFEHVDGGVVSIDLPRTPIAGWYADPANAANYRWWDGANWTGHVRAPEPAAAVVQAPRAPAVVTAPNVPPPPYYSTPPLVRVSNGIAHVSLVFGLLAAIIAVWVILHPTTIWYTSVGVSATILGIRALVRQRSGHVTVLWPAVLGLVLGAVGSLVIIVAVIVHLVAPTYDDAALNKDFPGTQASASVTPTIFSHNTDLTDLGVVAYELEQKMETTEVNGVWPSSITVDSSGRVFASGFAEPLGNIETGWTVKYTPSDDNHLYFLGVFGRTTGEYVFFDSFRHKLFAYCSDTDTTCVP